MNGEPLQKTLQWRETGLQSPMQKLAHLEKGRMKIKSSEEARSKLISWTTVPRETSAAAAGEDRGDRQILEIWEGEEEGPDGCDDVGIEGRGQGDRSMGGREGGHFHPSAPLLDIHGTARPLMDLLCYGQRQSVLYSSANMERRKKRRKEGRRGKEEIK